MNLIDYDSDMDYTHLLLGWPSTEGEIQKTSESSQFRKKEKRKSVENIKKYPGDGHLVTFAPTGSGKGVSVIIPNLLHYSGPTIVIDPKGENFEITAQFRQRKLKQKILLLDPFKAISDDTLADYGIRSQRLNPLTLSMLTDSRIDNDAQMIAEILSDGGGNSSEPFWDLCAKQLLSGLISHEMSVAKRKNREPSFKNVVDSGSD